jgi:hypothetical protein
LGHGASAFLMTQAIAFSSQAGDIDHFLTVVDWTR